MATMTGEAPSTGVRALQTAAGAKLRGALGRIEAQLESERNQLPLWLPVMLGTGIAVWFVLPTQPMWITAIAAGIAIALSGVAIGGGRRFSRVLLVGGIAFALGCGLIWTRAAWFDAPVVTRPTIAVVSGEIVKIERNAEKETFRLTIDGSGRDGVPSRVRVSIPQADFAPLLPTGTKIRVRTRLMPPAEPLVPGAHDFARQAWFKRLGATGKAIGEIEPVGVVATKAGLRERLNAHVSAQLEGSRGGIATALATGEQGGIAKADQEAMRASGLAHLLSISGLHISAVVAGVFLLTLRLLALSVTLALRAPLILIAAGTAALAGIGYTLLAGAEVPSVRSCIAACLVLIGLAIGREAITLRLVATGALIVLILWPESLVGPSFQLSFAAITAIVALHESKTVHGWLRRREEGLLPRFGRVLLALLLTGIAVEMALAPIALFHFHKSGLYGALANIVAIPLTTFVIMPLEALALLFDVAGLGAPFWWLTGQAIGLLLWLAHLVAGLPGAVAMLPSVPTGAYALMIGGGLWLLLWRSRMRLAGIAALLVGALWALSVPIPDLLITNDGRHMVVRGDDGRLAILRPRTGDYVRDVLAERAAYQGELDDLDAMRSARCSADACLVSIVRDGRDWTILATRSRAFLDWRQLTAACARADIVLSDRRLPAGCLPRWTKIDPPLLRQTGGLAIDLERGAVETVHQPRDDHPWIAAARVKPQYFRRSPAKVP